MGENQWPAISDEVGVWITHVDSYHCWGNHMVTPVEVAIVKGEPNLADGTKCFTLKNYHKQISIRLFPSPQKSDDRFPTSIHIFDKEYYCNVHYSRIAYCAHSSGYLGSSYFLTTDPNIMMLWLEFNKQRYIENYKNDLEMAKDNLKEAKQCFRETINDFRKSVSYFKNARNEFHNAISDFKHHKG